MSEITVTINNWKKYNSMSERNRHPSWFLLMNSAPTSHGLIGLTAAQKWVWICLLCEASRKNTATLRVNIRWLASYASVAENDASEAIDILIRNETLSVDCQLTVSQPDQNCQTITPHTDKQTKKQKDRQTNKQSLVCSENLVSKIPKTAIKTWVKKYGSKAWVYDVLLSAEVEFLGSDDSAFYRNVERLPLVVRLNRYLEGRYKAEKRHTKQVDVKHVWSEEDIVELGGHSDRKD